MTVTVTQLDPVSAVTMVMAVVFFVRLLVVSARACGRGVAALVRSLPAGTQIGMRLGRIQVQIMIGAPRR